MTTMFVSEDAGADLLATPTPPSATGPLPGRVVRHLVTGTSALGFAIMLERGLGFVANILAARFGGTFTFGAYSLGISTSNNISTYAAGGIGATAARFSGKYPRGTPGYSTLGRALAIVAVVSAAAAALGLWLGAGPLSRLLRRPDLATLLAWAAVSAAGIIVLECARGFFVGQRRTVALILLSVLVGTGMLTLLPLTAHFGRPVRMILCQGAITTFAVLVCLALSRPLQLTAPPATEKPLPLRPVLREVWGFGLVQLAGLVGANLAGWWLTTLVARADTTLVEMSFLAIGSQLRNIVGLPPSLLTESSYAVLAEGGPEADHSPQHVMAVCTFAATTASLLLAAGATILLPWMLRLLYGRSYVGAGAAVAVALAVAVAHMGNAPAAARLTIVSIRTTAVINTVWAVFVAGAASLLLLRRGSALAGMLIFFAAHVLSALLVLLALRRRDRVPAGTGLVSFTGIVAAGVLALLAVLRQEHPGQLLALTAAMLGVAAAAGVVLVRTGRTHHWLPTRHALARLRAAVLGRLRPSSAAGASRA